MARGADLRRRALALSGAAVAGLARAQAGPPQDVRLTAGPQAAHVLQMWHLLLGVCTAVFVAVLVAFAIALVRGRRRATRGAAPAEVAPDLAALAAPEPGAHRSVVGATVASVALLAFLIVASVLTDRALAQLSTRGALELQVTANQWWWEVRYDGPPSETFTTANEIHVPVGRTVLVRLRSDDVIHSLWVPSLAGKKDLIPGRDAELVFRADHEGTYRGQCAEFCGAEHAWMAFDVVADPPDRFQAWADHQRQPAPAPADAFQLRGQQLFVGTTCVMCHTVLGTTASATHGPDLTHVASRRTLAAGTLPNTPAALRSWIRDPQKFKPGSTMPASNLSDEDLDALVAWLETLR
jgi:cytochrome c oxidase subunit 2